MSLNWQLIIDTLSKKHTLLCAYWFKKIPNECFFIIYNYNNFSSKNLDFYRAKQVDKYLISISKILYNDM